MNTTLHPVFCPAFGNQTNLIFISLEVSMINIHVRGTTHEKLQLAMFGYDFIYLDLRFWDSARLEQVLVGIFISEQ